MHMCVCVHGVEKSAPNHVFVCVMFVIVFGGFVGRTAARVCEGRNCGPKRHPTLTKRTPELGKKT